MKKILSLVLSMLLLCSLSTQAFAASTSTLSTTVPAATYTLEIPANQDIPFGTTSIDLGTFGVSESSGFATGKNLKVTVEYDAFKSSAAETEIPYVISLRRDVVSAEEDLVMDLASGSSLTFLGRANGTVAENVFLDAPAPLLTDALWLSANSEDWGKALAGDYTTTIIFTTEVVVDAE